MQTHFKVKVERYYKNRTKHVVFTSKFCEETNSNLNNYVFALNCSRSLSTGSRAGCDKDGFLMF